MSADKGATTAYSETSVKSTTSSHAGSHTGSRLLYQLQLRLDVSFNLVSKMGIAAS